MGRTNFHIAMQKARNKEKTDADKMLDFHQEMLTKYEIDNGYDLEMAGMNGIEWDGLKVVHLILGGTWANIIVRSDYVFKGETK